MKTLQLFYECWLEIAKQERYQDKWLSDETIFRAIKAQFPSLEALGFNRGIMNKAISSYEGSGLDDYTASNRTGRFRRQAKGIDIYGNPKRNIWGYFVTTPGGLVACPPDGKRNFLSLLQDESISDRYSVARGLSEVIDLTNEIQVQTKAKRRAEAEATAAEGNKKAKSSVSIAAAAAAGSASAKIVVQSYWDSPEAKKLFLGTSTDERDVVDILQQRIERLQQVNRSPDGWRDLVDKHDVDNLCSPYDIFIIRQRCSILCLAYTVALEEMNSARWIEDCCAQAIYDSSRMGIEAAATTERTVADWNILLRANCEHFPLPDPKIRKQKKPLPDLLEYFREEITVPWVSYCISNLADLTVELARNELVTRIIPKCILLESQQDNDDEDETTTHHNETAEMFENNNDENQMPKTIKDSILMAYNDKPISMSTAWRWLKCLGFNHCSRRKSFFVDGHERPDVVFYRNEFCTNYLSKLEPRTRRWIQVTKETVERWKLEKRIPNDESAATRGYTYRDQTSGEDMIEFHVDDFNFLHSEADEMGFGAAGGNLSIRKPPNTKPLDEQQIDKYTVNVAKDNDGQVVDGAENWSLKYLMASCLDFAEEMTALQHVGKELGVSVIISPKFHAEMAGEGIEYSWGISKNVYRKKPLDSKKAKISFKALVKECTSRDILTTAIVRKLSRRARSYICAYYTLHQQNLANNCENDNRPAALTLPLIERLMKAFKTHRAAVDFDAGFVNSVVSAAIENDAVAKN